MSIYRSFLWWLLLAAFGALAWELLQPDLGEVIIHWHERTLTTTVAFALVAFIVILVGLWLVWYIIRLPYHAWQNYAQRQAKNRLNNGLTAFYEGRYARAQHLLAKAATEKNVRDLALLGARQAALAQEEWVQAAAFLEQLNHSNPSLAASHNARTLLKQGKAKQALELMLTRPASEWSPVARRIAIESAIRLQQFDLADTWLHAKNHGMSPKQQAELRALYQLHYLQNAASAECLWQRWHAVNQGASTHLAEAFGKRAQALGMAQSASLALVEASESVYQIAYVRALSFLAHNDAPVYLRLSALLNTHPDDPELLHTLGLWAMACGHTTEAIAYWQRAIAQGGEAKNWHQLSRAYAHEKQFELAFNAANNARRVLHHETPLPLQGVSLQETIAAEAVSEMRNEHGIPWLPL